MLYFWIFTSIMCAYCGLKWGYTTVLIYVYSLVKHETFLSLLSQNQVDVSFFFIVLYKKGTSSHLEDYCNWLKKTRFGEMDNFLNFISKPTYFLQFTEWQKTLRIFWGYDQHAMTFSEEVNTSFWNISEMYGAWFDQNTTEVMWNVSHLRLVSLHDHPDINFDRNYTE